MSSAVALGYLDELDDHPSDPSLAPGRFRDFPGLPRTLALLKAGRPEAAAEVALGGHDATVDRHPPFIRSWWLFLLARIELDRGAMSSSVSLFRRGEASQVGMNQPGLASWYVGGAAYDLVQTGAGREVDALLAGVDEVGKRDERLFGFLAEAARLWRRLGRSGRGLGGRRAPLRIRRHAGAGGGAGSDTAHRPGTGGGDPRRRWVAVA